MALVEVQKYRLVMHGSQAEELFDKLQRLECCQFIAPQQDLGAKDAPVDAAAMRKADDVISDTRFAIRFLEPLAENKITGMDKVLGRTQVMSVEELSDYAASSEFGAIADGLRVQDRKLGDIKTELSRLNTLKAQLTPIAELPYPLEIYANTGNMVYAALGHIAADKVEEFEGALKEKFGDKAEFYALPKRTEEATTIISVILLKEHLEDFNAIADSLGFAKMETSREVAGLPSAELPVIESKIEALKAQEADIIAQVKSGADNALKTAQLNADYWGIVRAKYESKGTSLCTEKTRMVNFWLPSNRLKDVKKVLEPYAAMTDLSHIALDEGEQPPTLLANPSWAAPYEPLTEMYGVPTYGKVDPTALMAPFFFLFFGMCLGDAGYGLVLSGILGYVLVRHKLSGDAKKFFIVLLAGSISTVIFGAITGSWFGDMIDAFPFMASIKPLKNSLQTLDPMKDPMTLLGISLAIGFFQLIFGLCVAMKECIKNKDYMGAFADKGGWIVFLVGLVMIGLTAGGALPAHLGGISKALGIGGALILLLTQGREKKGIFSKALSGLLSLYNVTAYLGDTLSYSRLLALGLSSAAIGMIVNLLCTLVWDVPYVGVILAVVIFVGGHVFSIAVSILGAFIHSLRLQYVEFFSKFYDANGYSFSPLRCETQFVRLSKAG